VSKGFTGLTTAGEDADADANAADPEGLTVGGTTNSSSSAVVGGGEVEFEVEAVNVGLTITSGSEGLRTPASLSPKFGGTSISASPLSACSACPILLVLMARDAAWGS